MNSKINLQQLAKTLAQKMDISQREAESFLREFFDGIVQNVTSDKVVKVKGLGTFKLIEVLDRESVNIKTGERIVIPGHSKLSFTPETALKDLVNKPFADFQTVVINEGTSIEEMERVPEEALDNEAETDAESDMEPDDTLELAPQDEEPEPEEDEEAEKAPARRDYDDMMVLYGPPPVRLAEERKPEPEVETEPAEEPAPEPAPAPQLATETETKPAEEPAPVAEPTAQPKAKNADGMGKKFVKVLLWTLGILLLCLLCFIAGRNLTQKPKPEVVKPEPPKVEKPVEAPKPEIQYEQVPNGEYKIVGTEKTYVMKRGDFITRIAIQEYGHKDFAQYIIVHNDFPDPDNVPVGMEIKLPKLEKIE